MLAATERVVVLLDEFDEMVRERQIPGELTSRFLTTAMLPKLAALSKQRKIVFIVATNHIDLFDVAISRHGRFDMLLQVMPPTAEEKLGHQFLDSKQAAPVTFRQWLTENGVTVNKDIDAALEDLTFDEFQTLMTGLSRLNNAQDIVSRIESTHKGCVLQSQLPDGGMSWKQLCLSQQVRMRIPPVSAAPKLW